MQRRPKAIAVLHNRCSLIQQRLIECLLHKRYWEYSSEQTWSDPQEVYISEEKQVSIVHVMLDHKESR